MNIRFALLAAAAAVTAMFVSGCGEDPADAAKSWHAAILSGDAEKANRYVVDTREARRGNEMWLEIIGGLRKNSAADPKAQKAFRKISAAKFSKPEIAGDRATVILSVEDEKDTAKLSFRQIDGKWKIVDIK